ncbi:MAG: hypothetical protein VYD85_11140, partial [Pseudomonadota bacterium]|nr:hypothetical protein [Pseudomonadota bacterium]
MELIDAQASLLVEDKARARLAFNAGVILEVNLDETQEAMERYLQAYRLDTTVPEYVIAGERIYRERENWVMVDELLQRRLDMSPAGEIELELLLEQGQIRTDKLGEPMAAYDALRRALRTSVPDGAQRVYSALANLVCDVWAWPAIEEGLWARIDNSAAPKRKARLLQEVSFLYLEFLKDTERGLQALRDAADACAGDPSIFERVTVQFEVHADDLVLARWLVGVRDRPLPEPLKFDSLARALQVYETLGADWLVVRDILSAILALRPTHEVLLPKALSAAERAQDHVTFVALLEQALSAAEKNADADAGLVLEWRRKLAKAHDAIGAFAESIQHHRAILQQWPLDVDAFEALSSIHREQQDWMGLSSLYQHVVRAREAEQNGIDVDGRLAWSAVLADELHEVPQAIECLEPLTDARPVPRKALATLKGLYRRQGDLSGEFGVLEIELTAHAGTDVRPVLNQMDQLLVGAVETHPSLKERLLSHKLAAMPESLTIRLQLAATYRDRGEFDELNDTLAAAWQAEPSEDRLDVLRERGRLLRYELRLVADAVECWETLLQFKPDDLEALAELQYLYDQEQR